MSLTERRSNESRDILRHSRLVICYEHRSLHDSPVRRGSLKLPIVHEVSVCKVRFMPMTNIQIPLAGVPKTVTYLPALTAQIQSWPKPQNAQNLLITSHSLFRDRSLPVSLRRPVALVRPCFPTWQNLYLPPPMLQKSQTMRKLHAFPKMPKTAKQPQPSIHSTPTKYHKTGRRVLLLSSRQRRIRKLWAKR